MRYSVLVAFLSLLILATAITVACGSSTSSNRILQTVNISPATAEGQSQFTAFGFYEPAYPVAMIVTATWGACYQNAPTTEISVSSTGFAKCASGANGTYTVWGWAPSGAKVCNDLETSCGVGGCQVTGTAQLTCP
jgi:hypothetical protein